MAHRSVLRNVSIPFKREGTFRLCSIVYRTHVFTFVSIPFNREGTFRLEHYTEHVTRSAGFHSLQTGRHIQTRRWRVLTIPGYKQSFHSLQTGRHIQTGVSATTITEVLRRFPFPSNGKAHLDSEDITLPNGFYSAFPFPSNGKAHLDRVNFPATGKHAVRVSIPFNREGHI